MKLQDFEELILEALEEVPPELAEHLANLQIEVHDWPSEDDLRQAGLKEKHQLLGLYIGVPLTQVGRDRASGLMPDVIKVFQRPIEALTVEPQQVKRRVRQVILHEIGHRFGISDERLHELGAY